MVENIEGEILAPKLNESINRPTYEIFRKDRRSEGVPKKWILAWRCCTFVNFSMVEGGFTMFSNDSY